MKKFVTGAAIAALVSTPLFAQQPPAPAEAQAPAAQAAAPEAQAPAAQEAGALTLN